MTSKEAHFISLVLVSCLAGLVGCSRETSQQPAQGTQPAPTAQPSPAAPPAQPAPPVQTVAPTPAAAPAAAQITPTPTGLGTAQYSANPEIRCDLLEVKRVSGGAVLARWRVVHAGPAKTADGKDNNIYYTFEWHDLYYIDPVENKRYSFLTDSEGNRILDTKWGWMKPGEQWLSWAKFPAPPPTSTAISLSIGGFVPFEDVPIGQ